MAMNREQRRKYNRLHKTNLTKTDFDNFVRQIRVQNNFFDFSDLHNCTPFQFAHMDNEELFPNGTKVKLNYEKIKETLSSKTETYQNWVELHKDEEFTLTREKAKNSLVCLEEDDPKEDTAVDEKGEPIVREKWLFDLYSDLLIYKEDTKEFLPAYLIDENAQNIIGKMQESGNYSAETENK